jgi:hypothetical protein
MKKLIAVAAAVVGATLVLVAGVQAGSGAQTTHATLPSGWDIYPMTCDETQVINGSQRKETFHCGYTGPPPSSAAEADQTNAIWFSDFDGAPAKVFHIVILPSGNFEGWATY